MHRTSCIPSLNMNKISQAAGAACRWLHTASTSAPICLNLNAPAGIIELRDYVLHASEYKRFLALSNEYAEARSQVYKGFLGMFTADTGGNASRVVHMYHFENYRARDATRRAAAVNAEWQRYTDAARSCILTKESTILLQAPADVYAAAGIGCASGFKPAASAAAAAAPSGGGSPTDQVVYELRNYRLRPGRNGVKALMAAFKTGLPSKLAADGVGQLALLAHSDVGLLNQVFEVYRYPSAQHLIEACERSRSAVEWQDAKAQAYELCDQFHISFLHPTRFSQWQ